MIIRRIILTSAILFSLNIWTEEKITAQAEAINIETGEIFIGEEVGFRPRDGTGGITDKETKKSYTKLKAKSYAISLCAGIEPYKERVLGFYDFKRPSWREIYYSLLRTYTQCKVSKVNEQVLIYSFEDYVATKDKLLKFLDKNWEDLSHIIGMCIKMLEPNNHTLWDYGLVEISCLQKELVNYPENFIAYMNNELLNIDKNILYYERVWHNEGDIYLKISHKKTPNRTVHKDSPSWSPDLDNLYLDSDFYDRIFNSSVAARDKIIQEYRDIHNVTLVWEDGSHCSFWTEQIISGHEFNPSQICNGYSIANVINILEDRINQEKIILAALVSRCINFGWDSDTNIYACVKQEAYRDLVIQEQKIELQRIEKSIANSYSQAQDDSPLFLDILNVYAQENSRKNNIKLSNDIAKLKSQNSSLKSIQNTQRALDSLYKN